MLLYFYPKNIKKKLYFVWSNKETPSVFWFHLRRVDEQKNFLTLKEQADKGIPAAQFQTALSYEDGKGVEQSYKSAFYYYQLAANQGHSSAQVFLAILYEKGLGTVKK